MCLIPRMIVKQVSKILSAATAGPLELDQCIKTLSSKDQLDDDLRDYLATLVKTEVTGASSMC